MHAIATLGFLAAFVGAALMTQFQFGVGRPGEHSGGGIVFFFLFFLIFSVPSVIIRRMTKPSRR